MHRLIDGEPAYWFLAGLKLFLLFWGCVPWPSTGVHSVLIFTVLRHGCGHVKGLWDACQDWLHILTGIPIVTSSRRSLVMQVLLPGVRLPPAVGHKVRFSFLLVSPIFWKQAWATSFCGTVLPHHAATRLRYLLSMVVLASPGNFFHPQHVFVFHLYSASAPYFSTTSTTCGA